MTTTARHLRHPVVVVLGLEVLRTLSPDPPVTLIRDGLPKENLPSYLSDRSSDDYLRVLAAGGLK